MTLNLCTRGQILLFVAKQVNSNLTDCMYTIKLLNDYSIINKASEAPKAFLRWAKAL